MSEDKDESYAEIRQRHFEEWRAWLARKMVQYRTQTRLAKAEGINSGTVSKMLRHYQPDLPEEKT